VTQQDPADVADADASGLVRKKRDAQGGKNVTTPKIRASAAGITSKARCDEAAARAAVTEGILRRRERIRSVQVVEGWVVGVAVRAKARNSNEQAPRAGGATHTNDTATQHQAPLTDPTNPAAMTG
jgi:hypothetical protein